MNRKTALSGAVALTLVALPLAAQKDDAAAVSRKASVAGPASVTVCGDAGNLACPSASIASKTQAQYKSAATLPFLSQASAADIAAGLGFRTNIGYFNPTASFITVVFQAYAASGAPLGSVTLTIPPLAIAQQPAFSLISTVPEGNRVQENFYVTWSASAPLLIYAAVADNKTDDVVYVE